MRREIPSLRVLCLRSIGPHACNAEKTFAPTEERGISNASRLLRSFHNRPVIGEGDTNDSPLPPMIRSNCVGNHASRRSNANDVDLNHPFVACRNYKGKLVMEHGSPALDCLQSYIDALVELGRMDDARLGINFFREWRHNVVVTRKRKRSPSPLGSLSLHNCSISQLTVSAMVKSGMGEHLGVLDLTGMHGLTDDLVRELIPHCPNLRRLSLKNCRRITPKSLQCVAQHLPDLTCLDVGGSYNLNPQDVLELIPHLPDLREMHASGLAWTDAWLAQLLDAGPQWIRLSIGFSRITGMGLRQLEWPKSLTSLALPFCEQAVDNAVVGYLGKVLPNVTCLDLRGNSNLSSLTGWFDARLGSEEKELLVLARYSNLQKAGVDETKRIHPLLTAHLTVVLDGGGAGAGIQR